MGTYNSTCILCGSKACENNHLVKVISLGKRHDQIFCVDCFVNQRLEYINSKKLKNYIDYINTKYNGE